MGDHIPSDESELQALMSTLNDGRDYEAARELFKSYEVSTIQPNASRPQLVSAHTYFLYGLATLLLGNKLEHAHAWTSAKSCEDFTKDIEGDFHRDIAMAHVTARDLKAAHMHADDAFHLHAANKSKRAADLIAYGKIYLAERLPAFALCSFTHSVTQQLEALREGVGDEQYLRNANIWRLLAAARLGDTVEFDKAFDLMFRDDYAEQDQMRLKAAKMLVDTRFLRPVVAMTLIRHKL